MRITETSMEEKKDLSIINCISTCLLAYFFTIPFHEFIHAVTHWIYGTKVIAFSAGAVQAVAVDYSNASGFRKVMEAGGSASIVNAIIAVALVIILFKVQMGPLLRVFLIQLMGAHFSEGIGYFMIGGFFGAGDWGLVIETFADQPGIQLMIHIILSVVGSVGIVALFFILNYLSGYFIEDYSDKKDKTKVAFRLHLLMLLLSFPIGVLVTALSPSEELNLGLGVLYNMVWIPFFWGFMFTAVMNVLPPKTSRFLYKLPGKPNWIVCIVSVILIMVDIFIFGPGLFFS